MEYMNDAVIRDSADSTAQKFAVLMSSRAFDFFKMNETTIRYKFISLLEKNFKNAGELRKDHRNIFYNSVTLLGEYYNRIRNTDGSLMKDLGSKLLDLLSQELLEYSGKTKIVDIKLANLLLSQV